MSAESPIMQTKNVTLPAIAALSVNARHAHILSADGEIQSVSHDQARMIIHNKPAMVCHAPYTRGRLAGHGQQAEFYPFDVLELFAFVHPGKFCVPTPHGLAVALGMSPPETAEDYPFAIMDVARALLEDLRGDPYKDKADPIAIAKTMGMNGKGWPWTPFVVEALGETYDENELVQTKSALNVWRHLPEWAEDAPPPPPSQHGVTGHEARKQLAHLLGPEAEKRAEQMDYTDHMAAMFQPVHVAEQPHMVLAEAGTGVGKTMGYLAPASVWSEKNKGAVWISTYTKNLQRQIEQELDRLYPDEELKEAHVAVRKGRENYLCLLNLEETAAGVATARSPYHGIAAGIMTRWAAATKDGDLTGADFPGWLSGLLGYRHTRGLSDTRGECIYSACDHYNKCFVERSVRKAKRSRIVIANHALVMIQSALSSVSEDMPSRYIFDEGHHLFSAADSAFAAHLTAQETRDLRRWILGNEGGKRGRARGLKRRVEDLVACDQEAERALEDILHHATCLTADSWTRRLKDGAPKGPTEQFLHLVYKQVHARANGREGPYSLETHVHPLDEDILPKAAALKEALKKLKKPMTTLVKIFRTKLAEDEGMLDSDTRGRLEAIANGLERRGEMSIGAWINMLETLQPPSPFEAAKDAIEKITPASEQFIDWMEIERIDGRAVDVGLYRHFIDPMKPFAESIRPHAHGLAVTSATLRDSAAEEDKKWEAALQRSGANFLTPHPKLSSFDSPFDYAAQTKIFIISDVNKNDLGQVSGAYRTLFDAAGGGALGLFTAISRLRAVHEKIAMPLEEKGISLYSQHVDDIDPGTLVDMFRDDTHACLLGTDAVRDGVDVPGESLRLIVFDRVPWPRPTILHKARREAFGGRQYDEMLTRLKLKQAFGRLIRRAGDKGVFVMLDSMLPSRLQTAFPASVEIEKIGLADTTAKIKEFLS